MNDIQTQQEAKAFRILVVGMTDRPGGLENFVIRYCEQLVAANIRFDFLCRFPVCSFADRIARIGGRVYTVTRRSRNPLLFYRQIYAFFKEHAKEYDAVWDNECMSSDLTPLMLAKRYHIRRRVYHSHSAGSADASWKGRIRTLLHRLHTHSLRRVATDYWACSKAAAAWAFPKAVLAAQAYRIIPNAVSTEEYRFDPTVRQAYRRSLGLDHAFVIGTVGHLQPPKNQSFLLEVFALFHRQYHDAVLLFAGDGADREALEQKTRTLGLTDAVRFLGHRNDVAKLLQAMDAFVMPSLFEGLGIAAVEAQVSGLPCVLSDRLPREVQFLKNVVFLPPDAAQPWSDALARMRELGAARADGSAGARQAGYDIRAEAGRLENAWRGGDLGAAKVS